MQMGLVGQVAIASASYDGLVTIPVSRRSRANDGPARDY